MRRPRILGSETRPNNGPTEIVNDRRRREKDAQVFSATTPSGRRVSLGGDWVNDRFRCGEDQVDLFTHSETDRQFGNF